MDDGVYLHLCGDCGGQFAAPGKFAFTCPDCRARHSGIRAGMALRLFLGWGWRIGPLVTDVVLCCPPPIASSLIA